MSFKLTFWTRRRIKILMVTLIIFGIFSHLIVNLFFPSFFHEHLAFSVLLLFAPFLADIWLFFFTGEPEIADWQIRVLWKLGYNVSEEEKEEVIKSHNDYNRFFVPAVLVYTFVWMIHIYYLESIDFYFLGEPIREGIHAYGFITYMFPLLFISAFIYWYTWRKYPASKRVDKLLGKIKQENEEAYRRAVSEVFHEIKQKN